MVPGSAMQCAIFISIVTAALLLQDFITIHWVTHGLWYGSIVINVLSVCLANQQSITLSGLCCYQNRWQRIRQRLGTGSHPTRPHKIQLVVLQVPIILASCGAILVIVGFTVSLSSNVTMPRTREDELVRPRGDIHQRAWRSLTLDHRLSNCSPLLGHLLVLYFSSASSF